MAKEYNGALEALETTEKYADRLQSYAGLDDPLRIQAQTPSIIGALTGGRTRLQLSTQAGPRNWSVRAILAHLADDELATGWRYRQMIEHCGVALMSFDEDLWARLGDYELRPACEAFKTFELLRVANLRLLHRLSREQWQRYGIHSERGRISVADLARHTAAHDLDHVLQLCGALDARGI